MEIVVKHENHGMRQNFHHNITSIQPFVMQRMDEKTFIFIYVIKSYWQLFNEQINKLNPLMTRYDS